MAAPISPERIREALAKADKLDHAYGEYYGPPPALAELRPVYQEVKAFLGDAWAMFEALQAHIQAGKSYEQALAIHVGELEQRAAELQSANPPEERALEEHLQAQHSEIRANNETLAQQHAALFSNRQQLSEQEEQLHAVGQQLLGFQQQVQRRAQMGVS
jgi:predicted RNase H-like nuclease (RuvC/YqgF family)